MSIKAFTLERKLPNEYLEYVHSHQVLIANKQKLQRNALSLEI